MCSDGKMTSGHPEASGLSDCLGKPRAPLMTPAWSASRRFFYPGLQMVNDKRLVNYYASSRRDHIRHVPLDEKIHLKKKSNEVKVQDYKSKNVLASVYIFILMALHH